MRSTAEISVVCLSVCLSSYVRKKLLLESAYGLNFAFSRRQFGRFDAHNTWHSLHYKDITDSEARRQEKLRRRGEGD